MDNDSSPYGRRNNLTVIRGGRDKPRHRPARFFMLNTEQEGTSALVAIDLEGGAWTYSTLHAILALVDASGAAYTTYAQLSRITGKSPRSVKRATAWLRDHGYLWTERTGRGMRIHLAEVLGGQKVTKKD